MSSPYSTLVFPFWRMIGVVVIICCSEFRPNTPVCTTELPAAPMYKLLQTFSSVLVTWSQDPSSVLESW